MSEQAQEAKGEDQPEVPPVEINTTQPQDPASVEVGQIWKDNDPRGEERYVQVLEIEEGRASVRQIYRTTGDPILVGRTTRIRLDRFGTGTGTSYTLVPPFEEIPEAPDDV